MNNKQLEVIEWWYTKRDYRTGIELLSRNCKNKTIISTLSKQGKENFPAFVKKLNYEVTKAVQLDWLNMPNDVLIKKIGDEFLTDIPPRESQKEKKEIDLEDTYLRQNEFKNDDENQYPRVIRRLKYESSELYNKRSLLHRDMRSIEQTNTEQNNKLRSDLLTEIKSISTQLAFYYGFLKKYEVTGVTPDETEIWPPAKEQAPEEPKSLPELKKLMGSLRRENYKDGFRLLYQQRTKAEKENPMPKGSKRDAIELRMKHREIKLAETITMINQFEHVD